MYITPMDQVRNDIDYFQAQTEIYKDALSSLNKEDRYLTENERFAKEEIIKLGEYNKADLETGLKENRAALSHHISKLKEASELPQSNTSVKREADSNIGSSNKRQQ